MLILDIILLLLIIICIIYCFRLSKKIMDLHNMREDFSNKIKELDKTILKVESNINNLLDLSKKSNEALNDTMTKSEKLSDDLILINKIGSDLVKRLEKNIDISKKTLLDIKAILQKSSDLTKKDYKKNDNIEEEKIRIENNNIKHENLLGTDNPRQDIFKEGITNQMLRPEDGPNLDHQINYYNRLRNIKTKK